MWKRSENALLREALTLYAGKHVLDKILDRGHSFLSPHGEAVELTMLFFDVMSVSAEGPGLTAVELGGWSVAYSTAMTETIGKHKGIFDVFVGDSGSAWWGADGAPKGVDRALTCARNLLKAADELHARFDQPKYPAIRLQIGVHTGLVSLGNFGSATRLRYTVMGDAVNFACRLAGVCSSYEVPVVVSQAVYSRASEPSLLRYLDSVRVKGIDDPVRLYAMEF